ncbi:MAG: pyrroline-5-carboxylate reductase [Candidatus Lernaella stagnicola]|nr:pyrroline-5-carboxylate reductase [Candidatus Lernaella stagnicola]
MIDKKIAVIGAGNMGEVLIRGLLDAGAVDPAHLCATEPTLERRQMIQESYGIEVGASNADMCVTSDIIILAIKPQNINTVLLELFEAIDESTLLISIAAGITTSYLAEHFPEKDLRIIRVMPNAPALVQAGASALCPGLHATEQDLALVEKIFHTIGKTVIIRSEELMDVVTGLSGSGPAFVFMMIEALSDAGVQMGLSRKVSNLLAAQTVYGAGKMFMQTGRHAGELRDLVATPGGTTFAGLKALEKGTFRSTVMDAVEAAAKKSEELGKVINGRK